MCIIKWIAVYKIPLNYLKTWLLIFGLCELRLTVEKQTCQGINILVFVASSYSHEKKIFNTNFWKARFLTYYNDLNENEVMRHRNFFLSLKLRYSVFSRRPYCFSIVPLSSLVSSVISGDPTIILMFLFCISY